MTFKAANHHIKNFLPYNHLLGTKISGALETKSSHGENTDKKQDHLRQKVKQHL